MSILMEKLADSTRGNVIRLSNGTVQVAVLSDVGPRIIFFGFVGAENQFFESAEEFGRRHDGQYHSYGGHRLWVSPEVERTYYPDNFPVEVLTSGQNARFIAPVENVSPGTGLQKEIEVQLATEGASVTVVHRITNKADDNTEMAPWALTVMKAGGRAILPFSPKQPMSKQHLLPEGVMALWSYTDLADSRWTLGTKYLQLTTEKSPHARFPQQMIGIYNPSGWAAYFRDGYLFVKKVTVEPGKIYPDFGCNFESYTEPGFLELETLAPLRLLKPGETAEHTERWYLYKDVPHGQDEAWIDQVILPIVQAPASR
ncbi:MAG TPA: hypothetical protein VKT29_08225 [Terriglobales bacterium]|nr:hypothetical protein [Terriglobales bacterium]